MYISRTTVLIFEKFLRVLTFYFVIISRKFSRKMAIYALWSSVDYNTLRLAN